ncbi:MAG: NfeD family protein [Alphaproteobacteria bacterium]|nr:NfeD family protein [Alphaproteobacteria bacterium]
MVIDASPVQDILFWHWWIVAAACFVLELVVPGVLFLWLGVGAVAAGFFSLGFPGYGWRHESMVLAGVSMASAVVGRNWWDKMRQRTDHPELNERAKTLIGRTGTLEDPIANGVGRLKLGDTSWKVRGPDLPAGVQVRITGADGSVLTVEAV